MAMALGCACTIRWTSLLGRETKGAGIAGVAAATGAGCLSTGGAGLRELMRSR